MPTVVLAFSVATLALTGQSSSRSAVDSYREDIPENARVAAVYSLSWPVPRSDSVPPPGDARMVFFSVPDATANAEDGTRQPVQQKWYAFLDSTEVDGAVTRSWLSGDECPNLYASLDWLSEIVIPSIHTGVRTLPAPIWTPRTPPPRPTHGPVHRVEGQGWAPDFDLATVSMSSTSGFLAQWGEATTTMLEHCWREDRPF